MKKSVFCFILSFLCILTVGIPFNSEAASINKKAQLVVSESDIQLDSNGCYAFLEATYINENGNKVDVNNKATWKIKDDNVVTVSDGEIYGIGKGSTIITVVYKGLVQEVKVTVKEFIDLDAKLEQLTGSEISVRAILPPDRYINLAKKCKGIRWTPTRNLTGWNGIIFLAGTTYNGIPYSQTPYQKEGSTFIPSLKYSDFYNTYYSEGRAMPRYGQDCSKFLSYCWGLPRKTTISFCAGIDNGEYGKRGSYNVGNLTTYALMKSYESLKRGDGLVCNKYYGSTGSHAMLVSCVDKVNDKVYVYEQTVEGTKKVNNRKIVINSGTKISIYSYSQLAGMKYMPFYKK